MWEAAVAGWVKSPKQHIQTVIRSIMNVSNFTRHHSQGLGLEMWHDFPPSHHGSGPVDSFGKDARRGMDADVKFGRYALPLNGR